jgi:hypothetical protein
MSQSLSQRQQRRARQRRQKIQKNLIWGVLGLAALAVVGVVAWQGLRPRAGDSVPVMTSAHIPTDSDPGQYNSDPPTSGPHYADEAQAGFYDANNYKYPAGYLVHNLEHGYVIFWYNCDQLSESACAGLKAQIRTVMDDLGGTKLIAYPWPSLDARFAMTSWGRLLKMQSFDVTQAHAFYKANLNHAPEPGAP